MSTIYSRVGGVGSAPSSRLTAGYLHTCSVKERRAGGGSEVECMELKLHFTAVGPSRPLILFKEVLSFNLSWTDEAGSSTWREEVEFTAVECETYYLISPRPLGSPAEGETLWSLTARADDEGKVSVSLNESRRRWGSRFWKRRWSAVVSSRGETQKLCSGFVSSNSFINLRVFFYSYLFCYDVAKNTKPSAFLWSGFRSRLMEFICLSSVDLLVSVCVSSGEHIRFITLAILTVSVGGKVANPLVKETANNKYWPRENL